MKDRAKYQPHPLMCLFGSRRIFWRDGMNQLAERGLISDLCVTERDVAPVDYMRVIVMLGAWWCDAEMYEAHRLSVKQQPK